MCTCTSTASGPGRYRVARHSMRTATQDPGVDGVAENARPAPGCTEADGYHEVSPGDRPVVAVVEVGRGRVAGSDRQTRCPSYRDRRAHRPAIPAAVQSAVAGDVEAADGRDRVGLVPLARERVVGRDEQQDEARIVVAEAVGVTSARPREGRTSRTAKARDRRRPGHPGTGC